MIHHTYNPSEDLKPFVKSYWTLESSAQHPSEKQVIVPDGCVEMIFHYGDPYKQYLENGDSLIQPLCFVIGQLTRPLEIEPTGTIGIFSVRFHPNGFMPLTALPLQTFENTAVPLNLIFEEEGKLLVEKMQTATSTADRILIIEEFLQTRLTSTSTVDRTVKSAVDTLLTANGQLSVEKLSDSTQINRRQLERKFAKLIGLSPKQLAKTIRLQATLKQLLDNQDLTLTTLAHENDYFDQSHFIKDFKDLTGLTPKEFYGSQFKMTTLFFDNN